jgi:hypothetical protein
MFTPDTTFNESRKMGDARISLECALAKFDKGNAGCDDGKVEFSWSGKFVAKDGSNHRASFWDWKGGLRSGHGVSVWIDNPMYLPEFIKYIET